MKGKRRSLRSIPLAAMIALAICWTAPAVFAELNYVKQTVTKDGLGDGRYAVNDGGQVAWVGRVAGVDQIFCYSHGTNTQVTANTTANIGIESLQINDLGQIAWSQYDYVPGGLNVNVYLYDGNTYKQLNVNAEPPSGWYSQYPHLNNRGQVAWIQSYQQAPEGWDVYLYTSGTVQRLTNDLSRQWPPRLNDSGWVTWCGDRRQDSDWDTRVYLYDGATTQIIAYTPEKGSFDPQINNQGQVAWLRYDTAATPYYNIYVWDGHAHTRITNIGAPNFNGSYGFVVNNAGQIAWSWGDGVGQQIYLYSGASVSQLTNDYAINHVNCRLRENGWLAWMQDTGGLAGDIYVYRDGRATRIDQGAAFGPQLNSRGQVVWANYYPIFLAGPAFAPPGLGLLLD